MANPTPTPAPITTIPDAKIIADLAAAARGFTLYTVESPAMGAEGLPEKLMVGFDHRRTGSDAVIDLNPFLEKYRTMPERKTGTAHVDTLQSFIELVNRHKTDHSVIFSSTDYPDPSLTAVIDYHERDSSTAAFLRHRIQYDFPVTDEFQAWIRQNAQVMSQSDFAAFVEDRIAEIATPDSDEIEEYGKLFQTKLALPNEMMELSRGLEINVNGVVKNAQRLQSGEAHMVFAEEHQTSLTVPGMFIVSVPPFLDGDAVRLPARLRYRVQGGKVVWFYQLYKHREFLRDRIVADLDWARNETELPAFEGSPEA